MFDITLITMGKLKEKFYISAAEEYKKRLGGYCKFTLLELPEVRLPEDPSPAEISAGLEKEADSIRYRIATPGMPFSQARIPAQERVTWSDIPELIWALLSPERSVLDAIRLRDAVHSDCTSDEKIRYYLSYFRFLAKYGYLEEVQ